MTLSQALEITRGLTSIIGSGGKSTLLATLGRELAAQGRVILCTTAKMFPVPGFPLLLSPSEQELCRALEEHRAVCVGKPFGNSGKLCAPGLDMERLMCLSDYVLAEADGSAGLPLKAHAEHEPPVLPQSSQSILVLGANGLDRPICKAAHRPEIFAHLAGLSETDAAGAQACARVLTAEALHTRVFINRFPENRKAALELAALLRCPVLAGEARSGSFVQLA